LVLNSENNSDRPSEEAVPTVHHAWPLGAIHESHFICYGFTKVYEVIDVIVFGISAKILFKVPLTYASSQQLNSVIDTNVEKNVQRTIACDTRVWR
jgi:hypothetical protein